MRKKYLVIGDYIKSKNDNDRHYISSRELVRLYGVNPKECILHDINDLPVDVAGLFILFPRYDGDYKEYLETLTKDKEIEMSIKEALGVDEND